MILRRMLKWFPGLLGLRIKLIVLSRIATYPLRFLPGNSKTFGPPRKLYYFAGDAPGCTLIRLAPSYTAPRTLPVTNSRLVKDTFAALPQPTVEEAYVATFRNGRYFGDGGGCVVTEDDGLIWTLSPTNYTYKQELHQAFSRVRLSKPASHEKAVHLATRCAESNYWHWLMDCVTRVRLLVESGVDTSGAKWIIDHRYLPYQVETLQFLGIPEDAVIVPKYSTHIEAKELIVPSYTNPMFGTATITYSREGLDFLKNTFLQRAHPRRTAGRNGSAKRIYISRKNSARTIDNEAEVTGFLESEGFSVLLCEEFSVRQQAEIFEEARIIVGLHGAALTNIVFCRPGAKVIEIFPPEFVQSYYWTLSNQLQLFHACYCEDRISSGSGAFRHRKESGTAVELENFKAFLRPILQS